MRMRWMVVVLMAVACEGEGAGGLAEGFDPPSEPPHEDAEDGYLHAEGKGTPFLCKDERGSPTACPTDGSRPSARDLSCDASGCHGGNDFSGDADRHLLGSDGPSCTTCHGREWDARVSP